MTEGICCIAPITIQLNLLIFLWRHSFDNFCDWVISTVGSQRPNLGCSLGPSSVIMSDDLMGGMEFLGNTSLTMMIEETVASLGRDMFVLSSYQAPSFVWSIVTPIIVQSVNHMKTVLIIKLCYLVDRGLGTAPPVPPLPFCFCNLHCECETFFHFHGFHCSLPDILTTTPKVQVFLIASSNNK